MTRFFERQVSSRIVYRGKILNLRVDTVELPNGKQSTREVVDYHGAVAIVALTGQAEVLMVRQFRYPAGCEFLEIPAGKIEAGEDPLVCARRELSEETGAQAERWELLYSFYSTPGFSTEKMYLYLATGLTFKNQHPDEDEFLDVERIPLTRAVELLESGEIKDAKSIIGILAATRLLSSRPDLQL